jgi:argininosuccinate synthase
MTEAPHATGVHSAPVTPAKVLLAFSGSVEDAAALASLATMPGIEVVTMTLDVGQREPVEQVRASALACGAARAVVVDAREEFVRECVLPWVRARALDQPGFAALLRPLIARKLIETAQCEGASAVAHGSVGDGIDREIAALGSGFAILRPADTFAANGVASADYARERHLAVTPANGHTPHAHLLRRHCAMRQVATETAAQVEIAFEDGVPRAVNGVAFSLAELLESLSVIAGQHGVGRIGGDIDAPAAPVLHSAYHLVGTATGVVRLTLFDGTLHGELHSSLQNAPHADAAVNHA